MNISGSESPLILVVEDDHDVRDSILRALRLGGFRTRDCLGRDEIMREIVAGECAAIVLDLGLPGDDGVSIAIDIRACSAIPIIMLTGRAGIHERVRGLDAGADDYLVKPFARDELVARLRALLRRAPRPDERDKRAIAVSVQIGDARLVLASRLLEGPRGSERLTEREIELLVALCRSDGLLSRQLAYQVLFQRSWDPLDRKLDVHMSNLRRKLEAVTHQKGIISTKRGEGYDLRAPSKIETERLGD
jgi:DNA-binding response OmpR family regulator